MKALELDLTGSNITVAMEPINKEEFSQRFGFVGASYERPGSLQHVVRRHLEHGSNYIVLDKPILLDSQLEYRDLPKSMFFYYTPMENNPDSIFLRIKGVNYSLQYGELRKIGFRELLTIAEELGLNFAPIPNKVEELYKSQDFGLETSKPSETPLTETESALRQPEEKWLMLHGLGNVRKSKVVQGPIVPPKIRWKLLTDYDLSNLERDFVIADFERRVYHKHASDVLGALLDNELFDIVFSVVDLGEGNKSRFGAIDAQHRLVALKTARDMFGLKTYNIMLAIFGPEDARKIYRNVNLGKPLTAADRSKAWDDGSISFFNELRKSLSHYPTKNKMTFIEMLHNYRYSKYGVWSPKLRDAEKVLPEITQKEIEKIKVFLSAAEEVWGSERTDNPMYRVVVVRNMFRVFSELNLSYKKLISTMEAVRTDKKIVNMSRGRHKEDFGHVYEMVKKRATK